MARPQHTDSWLDRPAMVVLAITLMLGVYVGGVWLLWHSIDLTALSPAVTVAADARLDPAP